MVEIAAKYSLAYMAAAYVADRIVNPNPLNSMFSLYIIFVTKSQPEFSKHASTKIIHLIWLTLSRGQGVHSRIVCKLLNTRSLRIRLQVHQVEIFFKVDLICCVTLVRWATPTTPRRTTFLHELIEKKNQDNNKTLSITFIRKGKSKFKLLNELLPVYKVYLQG